MEIPKQREVRTVKHHVFFFFMILEEVYCSYLHFFLSTVSCTDIGGIYRSEVKLNCTVAIQVDHIVQMQKCIACVCLCVCM